MSSRIYEDETRLFTFRQTILKLDLAERAENDKYTNSSKRVDSQQGEF